MKTVIGNSHLIHRTLEEHPIPIDVLKAAEQFDPEDPIGYSGDCPSSYVAGNWDMIKKRRWGHYSNR